MTDRKSNEDKDIEAAFTFNLADFPSREVCLRYLEHSVLLEFKNRLAADETQRLKPLAEMSEREVKEKAVYILEACPTVHHALVWRLYTEGKTYRQISKKYKISIGKISKMLHELEKKFSLPIIRHQYAGGAHVGNTYRKDHTSSDITHRKK